MSSITLNAATFHSIPVEPTLINFFYGNNGTGKSTIAREIGADSGLAWQNGKTAADYSVLIYNQEFVRKNFQYCGSLKGVFTVGEQGSQKLFFRSRLESKCTFVRVNAPLREVSLKKEQNQGG